MKMENLDDNQFELEKFSTFNYTTESEVQMLFQTKIVEEMEQNLMTATESSEFFHDKIESL